MAKNAAEIVVAQDGSINVAPFGTTLPTDPTSALTGFVDLGYVGSTGVTFTATPSVTDITSWQSSVPTRKIVTARALTCAWTGQQWNLDSFSMAFGGGKFTQVSSGKYRYDPPADTDALTEYSLVIDAQDGSKNYRWVIKRGTVDNAVALGITRTGAADLPVTFTALAAATGSSWYFLTDDVNLTYES